MSKKGILIWAAIGVFVFGLGFGITALIDQYNSKPKATLLNPDGLTEQQAAAQTVVVSETMTYYSKTASSNMEDLLNDLKKMNSSSGNKNNNSR